MQLIESIDALREHLRALRSSLVGFVPTMGYLHEGHMSLMRRSAAENAVTVVSIFVNPTQFGPGEDLDTYPSDREGDAAKARASGADVLFLPGSQEMYPEGDSTWVRVEGLTESLCGRFRPEHFQGVTTVVSKLFHIVGPDRAYFGQKDYQQLAVIQRMVRDLHMPIEIIGVETVREADGLAMSSRNAYLTAEQRPQAVGLRRALLACRAAFEGGERRAAKIIELAQEQLREFPLLQPQYIELVEPETLAVYPPHAVMEHAVMALAVHLGSTRLIDNIRL